jgi:hypothetical protein
MGLPKARTAEALANGPPVSANLSLQAPPAELLKTALGMAQWLTTRAEASGFSGPATSSSIQ